MSGQDADDRQHEASQKRLDDMRKEGRIIRSADLLAAASLLGFSIAVAGLGPAMVSHAALLLSRMMEEANTLSAPLTAMGQGEVPGLLFSVLGGLAPLFLLPGAAVILAVTVLRGWVFAASGLEPKLSRISPLATARHKFGPQGLFDFGKGLAKLAVIAVVTGWFVLARLDAIVGTALQEADHLAVAMSDLSVDLLFIATGLAVAFGAADLLWQVLRHRRQAMMTRREVTDEHKESGGDPHMKAHRRQRGQEIALNRMLQDVPKADVVLVNPTHFAVALKWNRRGRRAPVCVAKGQDEIAARIRERAAEAGVPIHHDPPTTRALHAALDIGDEIGREHYEAVAAAIRFAEAMRRKAARRRK